MRHHALKIKGGIRSNLILTLKYYQTVGAASITLPNTINNGDLIILCDHTEGTVDSGEIIPTGFTKVLGQSQSISGGYFRCCVSFKVGNISDRSVVLNGLKANGSYSTIKHLSVFSTGNTSPLITAGGGLVGITTGDPATQTVASGALGAPCIAMGYCRGDAAMTITSTSTNTYYADGNPSNIGSWWTIFNPGRASTDVTYDVNDTGATNFLGSFWIKVDA